MKLVRIPKENSNEKRPLGISNCVSKCAQELIHVFLDMDLEVEYSKSPAYSFGSRAAHSSEMALRHLIDELNKVLPTFIINLDVHKCFDMISHDAILRETKERIHPEL